MASIQRIVSSLTGTISYRAQVRLKGRPSESETFTNRKDAVQWAASIESAIAEGKNFPHRAVKRTEFAALAQRYRDNVLKDWREPSKNKREQHLNWWEARFAGLTLAEVTPDRVAEARDTLAAATFTRGKLHKTKDGEQIAPKQYTRSGSTVNRYLAALSHVFTLAVKEWHLVDRNPVANITKKREARGRVRFLSDTEREALLGACEKSEWRALHTLVLLAISTGARRSELLGLKWTDVDLTAARAVVHETKNGDPRVLPLVGKALQSVRELKLQNSARSAYLFPALSGLDEPYKHFDGYWYEALKTAGIENFRFHDLRHTTASYLASQGASLLEIADVLGHRTMAMVKRYSHLAQGHKTTVVEKMAKERGL